MPKINLKKAEVENATITDRGDEVVAKIPARGFDIELSVDKRTGELFGTVDLPFFNIKAGGLSKNDVAHLGLIFDRMYEQIDGEGLYENQRIADLEMNE